MKHKKDSGTELHDAQLRKAIEQGYKDESDEARTTLYLPLWLRKVFADINEEYDVPLYVVMSRSVRLGTSIIQHDYKDKVDELKDLWRAMRWTDNIYLSGLPDHKFSVNSMVTVKKKFIRLPVWCHNSLGKMAKQLNTDSSAMIRLALYVALLRWDSLTIRCERHIEKEVAKFEKQIDDQLIILRLVSKSNENGVSQYSAIMKPRKAYKKEGT